MGKDKALATEQEIASTLNAINKLENSKALTKADATALRSKVNGRDFVGTAKIVGEIQGGKHTTEVRQDQDEWFTPLVKPQEPAVADKTGAKPAAKNAKIPTKEEQARQEEAAKLKEKFPDLTSLMEQHQASVSHSEGTTMNTVLNVIVPGREAGQLLEEGVKDLENGNVAGFAVKTGLCVVSTVMDVLFLGEVYLSGGMLSPSVLEQKAAASGGMNAVANLVEHVAENQLAKHAATKQVEKQVEHALTSLTGGHDGKAERGEPVFAQVVDKTSQSFVCYCKLRAERYNLQYNEKELTKTAKSEPILWNSMKAPSTYWTPEG